ncbi:hypothetical protein [Gallibacterium sp. AGMB14963]|uniref:hypothetical protein n=1 Tax=Gallibacterium faecale TaxID=3019086 RepID=UPI0022F1DDBB|nr:hypothetical protein [Gallibacterium sp. AGMB14963]MDA3978075.1 hypothetical protein [Gallibacterium sp. AGMB14963]
MMYIETLMAIAQKFRENEQYQGGYIRIFQGRYIQAYGWSLNIGSAHSEKPGALLIGERPDDCYIAVGGNRCDGAEKWVRLTE